MTRSCGQLGLICGALASLVGCGQAADPSAEPGSASLSQLSALEITTVTTVQASSGIFLSARPQQLRPAYVERGGEGQAEVAEPSADLDRAKVDSALLFRYASDLPGPLQLQATFSALSEQMARLPQHFFPALEAEGDVAQWPLELRASASEAATDAWTEWDGWGAFPGLPVGAARSEAGAPAATLDYEMLGLQSPLVLSSDGDDIIVTNRSDQAISQALLVFSHADGVGIQVVADLGPGMQRWTTTGPKEANAEVLLERGRRQLETFFADYMGVDAGLAVARSKSIPFLETQGLRLIYMLDEQQAPAAIELPPGLAGQERFVICQAEVLAPIEEARVSELLDAAELQPNDVPTQLGRFARAKLEAARMLGNEHVQQASTALLETLSE